MFVAFDSFFFRPDRNERDLIRDLIDENYHLLYNQLIVENLEGLLYTPGPGSLPGDLTICRCALTDALILSAEELALLMEWNDDMSKLMTVDSWI